MVLLNRAATARLQWFEVVFDWLENGNRRQMTHIWCMTLPQWIQKSTGNRLAVRSVRVDAWETEAAPQGPATCLSDRLLGADLFPVHRIPLLASSSRGAGHSAPGEMRASRWLEVFLAALVGTGCAAQSPGGAERS